MCSITIHGILIRELFKRSARGSFLHDDFLQTVYLGHGQSGPIEENIVGPVLNSFLCFDHLIGNIADRKDIALVLPQ